MGSTVSMNKKNPCEGDTVDLREKVRLLQEELFETKCKREMEIQAYEEQVGVFMLKEAEWKGERKGLKEEVRRLRKTLEEKEEIIQGMEDEMVDGKSDKEWQLLGTNFLVEQMREEQARRDETVEKWKRLYLVIKAELDALIQRTRQAASLSLSGERLYQEEEEDIMETLQRELKGKEEIVEALKARVAAMEEEGVKREREVDILRQSLRILSSKKRLTHISKGLSRSLHL